MNNDMKLNKTCNKTISLKDNRAIWCCACSKTIMAGLTNCSEIYPHRPDITHILVKYTEQFT